MCSMCVYVCAHSHAMECMWEAREQFKGVGSLLPLCGFGVLNSGISLDLATSPITC